jgi:hypothetical protein
MRKYVYLLVAAVIAAFPMSVCADTISTFDFDNFVFISGAASSGNITINTTTGVATGLSFSYSGPEGVFSVSEIQGQGPTTDGSLYFVDGASSVNPLDSLSLVFQGASLANYAGGPTCTGTALCPGITSVFFDDNIELVNDPIQSGDLTLVSSTTTGVTPEPTSIVLFGTGLIAATGVFRRKFFNT